MASHAATTCASRLMRFGASHAGETANVATVDRSSVDRSSISGIL